MVHELLLKNIATHISLSQEEEYLFLSLLKVKKIKRKQFLLVNSYFDVLV
jgi:hypothetical protein